MENNWEYKQETVLEENLVEHVNQLGKEGWEVYDQLKLNENTSNPNYQIFLKRLNKGPQLLKS